MSFALFPANMATDASYRFGQHIIKASVVFFRSKLSYGFVNRKPVVPGHVLVAPLRIVKRFCELTEDEVADLFLSTQKISGVIEQEFKASSLTVAIQDGPDAGQTVPHVHVHILPRRKGDFQENDDVYTALEGHDKDDGVSESESSITTVDGVEKFRSEDEMSNEAAELAQYFK